MGKVYDCVIKELFNVQSNSKDAKGKFGESSWLWTFEPISKNNECLWRSIFAMSKEPFEIQFNSDIKDYFKVALTDRHVPHTDTTQKTHRWASYRAKSIIIKWQG